jgi:hypothetical protein
METSKIIETVKERFNHHESKKYLEEKYTSQLILVSQGGTWKVSAEFIATLRGLKSKIILLDIYKKPVLVNAKLLHEECESHYNTVMNNWLNEFSSLSKKR